MLHTLGKLHTGVKERKKERKKEERKEILMDRRSIDFRVEKQFIFLPAHKTNTKNNECG